MAAEALQQLKNELHAVFNSKLEGLQQEMREGPAGPNGADAAGPPPKVAKSRATKQPRKVACIHGQACITKDAAD